MLKCICVRQNLVVGRRSFSFGKPHFQVRLLLVSESLHFLGAKEASVFGPYQVVANLVDFWIGCRWVVYVKNAYSFMGKLFPPLPQNQILVWRCKRILNIVHARWFNQSDLFGEWWISVTLLGMVENVTSNEKGDEVWSHPLTWWLLLFESSWSCDLHHPKLPRIPGIFTHPEAAHTTPMEQNNVTLEQHTAMGNDIHLLQSINRNNRILPNVFSRLPNISWGTVFWVCFWGLA